MDNGPTCLSGNRLRKSKTLVGALLVSFLCQLENKIFAVVNYEVAKAIPLVK
jgi:hypothetical protein